MAQIIERVNDLFEGDLTDGDQLVYVNDVLKGKLLESAMLGAQAVNNTKEQFSNLPDFNRAIRDAVMDAVDAHTTMSTQALDSEKVMEGLKAILLGPAQLYETLRVPRQRDGSSGPSPSRRPFPGTGSVSGVMDLAGPSHADRTDVVDEVPATKAARTRALDSRGGEGNPP